MGVFVKVHGWKKLGQIQERGLVCVQKKEKKIQERDFVKVARVRQGGLTLCREMGPYDP